MMRNISFISVGLLSFLVSNNPVWAAENLVQTNSWDEIITAAADSLDSPLTIELTDNVNVSQSQNFLDYYGGDKFVLDGKNYTVTGDNVTYPFAIFSYNPTSSITIQNINVNNFSSSSEKEYTHQGGAIKASSPIVIKDSTFSNNFAQSERGNDAQGGAIYIGEYKSGPARAMTFSEPDMSVFTLINTSFYNNYVKTDGKKETNPLTQGGAIYTNVDLKIKADAGESVFKGNEVIWADQKDSSAIFLSLEDLNKIAPNLTLDSVNNGLIQFDDKITAINGVENALEEEKIHGAAITEDGNGGYFVETDEQKQHWKNKDGQVYRPTYEEVDIEKDRVDEEILSAKEAGFEVTQNGNNYTVYKNGTPNVSEFTIQEDGKYTLTRYNVLSPYYSNIDITGDNSSHVVFNNKLENIAKIDISGTNVDANEGIDTIYRTITHDDGVLNVNAKAKAEDSIINNGGTLNVADTAKIYRTEVNDGGTLHVVGGGYAEDTTLNGGSSLIAEDNSELHNMLVKDNAHMNIDAGAYLTGNIIIHAGAIMDGTYDYSKIFKDDVTDKGSLTLVGGLNDILNENSLVNTTAEKKLNLTAGEYIIGDGAQAVNGWDLLTFKDTANVKLEGNIALNGPNKKVIIENGSSLNLAGHSPSDYTIVGSVSNDGLMTFSHTDDGADDVTTIYGNYKAYTNAKMEIDVDPINNVSDLLKIEGDVEGKTDVILNSINYNGKPTQLIKYVEALNDNLDTGASFDIYRVQNSAYDWKSIYIDGAWYTGTTDLISDDAQNGYGNISTSDLEDDENLEDDAVLPPNFPDVPDSGGNSKNPDVVGEVIAYMGLPSAGIEQTRTMTRNVANKVTATKLYNRTCHGFYDCAYDGEPLRNAWAMPIYSYSDVKAPYSFEAEISGFEGGFDIQSDAYNRLGVFGSYRQGSYDFDGNGDDYYSKVGADMDIDSYILGLYHRYDEGKKWLMSQIFLGYQDVSLSSNDGVSSSTDGIEFGGAIEGGLIFNPLKDLTVEPSLRLAYTQINYDDATDNYGKTAKYDDVRNIEVEAGVKVEKTYLRKDGYAKIYVKLSIIQNIGSGDVTVTSLNKVDGLDNATLGRLEIGGSMSFDEKWSGYANTSYTFGSDYTNAAVNLGLNYAFQ